MRWKFYHHANEVRNPIEIIINGWKSVLVGDKEWKKEQLRAKDYKQEILLMKQNQNL